MANKNTQRTIKYLREQGMIVDITERFISRPGIHGIRKDLFGFIDLIALDPAGPAIIGVQSCGQDYQEHYRKITDSEITKNTIAWLKSGGKIELWAWRKVKLKRGGKAMVWRPRITEITLANIGE